ncbi:MAG TPA: ATP-binding protein, partial [Acidimicrobiales bacterium]|nr:ATP-binding protein [Acidimicrobiales bacterium]
MPPESAAEPAHWSEQAQAEPVVVRLPPELRSVSEARTCLTRVALSWGCDEELLADGRIVLSELMSNGVLHARTELQVAIHPRPGGGLRVEVKDLSSAPVLPPLPLPGSEPNLLDRPRSGSEAHAADLPNATGRGLHLVSVLSTTWGWFPEAGGGKTVWAELGPIEKSDSEAERSYSERSPYPLRPVRVIAAPVRLVKESEDHFEDLFRELQMTHLAGDHEPMGELAAKAEMVRSRLSRMREPARRALWEAMRRGDRLIDISLIADTGMPTVFETTEKLLVEATSASLAGLLLTEGPAAEVNEWRRWLRAELEGQIAGKPPKACPFPVASPLGRERGPEWDRLDAARRNALAELKAVLAGPVVAGQDGTGAGSPLSNALECAVTILGARRAVLNVLDDDSETVHFGTSIGFSPVVAAYWGSFPVSADLPSCEAIRTAKPVLFRTFAELDERYPVFLSTPAESDPSLACLPLVPTRGGAALGSFVLGFPQARDFNPAEIAFMRMIAAELADFIAGERDSEASARAWHLEREVETASATISAAVDKQRMVDEFLNAVVSLVADAASLHLLDAKGQLHYLGTKHRDAERQRAAEALFRRPRTAPSSPDLIGSCAAT